MLHLLGVVVDQAAAVLPIQYRDGGLVLGVGVPVFAGGKIGLAVKLAQGLPLGLFHVVDRDFETPTVDMRPLVAA